LDPRFKKINRLLIDYSKGNFNTSVGLSGKADEIDAFISNINMLGEELKETTIRKNFFTGIFNSVSDMIFVLNAKGIISDANRAACNALLSDLSELKQQHMDNFIKGNKGTFFQNTVKIAGTGRQTEGMLITKSRNKVPVLCTIDKLISPRNRRLNYILTAKDISELKRYQHSLAESELKYRSIFEESSDLIFICDAKGKIYELNPAGRQLIESLKPENQNLFSLVPNKSTFKELLHNLKPDKGLDNYQCRLQLPGGGVYDCLLSVSPFFNDKQKIAGYRGMLKNISPQTQMEGLRLRTITETQEQERKRFAKDIHDSIGQQLSAIKFYLGAALTNTDNHNTRNILARSNEGMIKILADVRDICFNLMPKTLENFGLVYSIKELCSQTELSNHLTFSFTSKNGFPDLNKQMEISIFRIIQEFISNALKHGNATEIIIRLSHSYKHISIFLKDNGKGFHLTVNKRKKQFGLDNIETRVKSYNGTLLIKSAPGKGTSFQINLPRYEQLKTRQNKNH
jgi:PAS domain S-box-containing protein